MRAKLLADIGNTHFHIYDGQKIEHLPHEEALVKYSSRYLSYICVKQELLERLKENSLWTNIAKDLYLEGMYETMGIDRRALCLSRPSGIFVDAGSAITVDVVEDAVYLYA